MSAAEHTLMGSADIPLSLRGPAPTRVVAGFANGSVDRASYQGRPEKLLAEIAAAAESSERR